jgi:hypothetical protein
MHIAVLGAGGVGACTALEIASRGHSVDLYERDLEPVMRATRVNEGKVHQGFVYAHDRSGQTAELMAKGALAFSACLSRWIDLRRDALHLSTPFVYAVHHDTMVNVDHLRKHYASCCAVFEGLRARSGLCYLDSDEPASFRELRRSELEAIVEPDHIHAAFVTSERGVDPRLVAGKLRQAVKDAPLITFLGGATVESVAHRADGGYSISFDQCGHHEEGPYDQVVNALWEGRLAIDWSMGIEVATPWIYRHKFGSRVDIPLAPSDLPSVTVVLGPFGDVVNYGGNGLHLSWYPIGMVAASSALKPPAGWDQLDESFRRDIFERSLQAWSALCPPLRELVFREDQVEAASGVIFAWGDTDIDDPESRLHQRHQIGIDSVDGYHSVNTGKYTMVPYLALSAAARVLGFDLSSLGLGPPTGGR